MTKLPRLTALAVATALALPALAQLNLPGMKQKEVEKLSKSDIAKELVFKKGDIDRCKEEHQKKEPKVTAISPPASRSTRTARRPTSPS